VNVIVGLFEANGENWPFAWCNNCNICLIHYVIVFVKNEGKNLTTMVTTLCSIVDCEPLNLQWFYENTCFGWLLQKNTSRP
jgi:hypothetical protein